MRIRLDAKARPDAMPKMRAPVREMDQLRARLCAEKGINMTDYVLPRTESGKINFELLEAEWALCQVHRPLTYIFKSIDAAARAEERERCAALLEDEFDFLGDEFLAADAIRNLGDSHE